MKPHLENVDSWDRYSSKSRLAWGKAGPGRLNGISGGSVAFAPSLHDWGFWMKKRRGLLPKVRIQWIKWRTQSLFGSGAYFSLHRCLQGDVSCDWSGLSHMSPLWQGGWDTRRDSPTRPPEWRRGAPQGRGAGSRVSTSPPGRWMAECLLFRKPLLQPVLPGSQINEVSHSLELLAPSGTRKKKKNHPIISY